MINILQCDSTTIYDVSIADNFMKRLCGYMLRKRPHCKAIIIKPCNSIHTFFMRFNLDVLFLDREMKVIKKIEDVRPGKIILPIREAVVVIEAETGSFCEIKEGEKVIVI